MITGREATEDAARKPIATPREHRRVLRPFAPLARRELLDLVARLAAEQLSEICASLGTMWTTSVSAFSATANVRFLSDRHTKNRGGSMLHWVANPTKQPAIRSPAAAVTMNIG